MTGRARAPPRQVGSLRLASTRATVVAVRVDPFAVSVSDAVVQDLRERIRRTRWPDPAPGTGGAGRDLDYLRGPLEYWADGFDWRSRERWLNRFEHRVAHLDGVRIHFVHHRAAHGGLPLILTHGWPSTFFDLLASRPSR